MRDCGNVGVLEVREEEALLECVIVEVLEMLPTDWISSDGESTGDLSVKSKPIAITRTAQTIIKSLFIISDTTFQHSAECWNVVG